LEDSPATRSRTCATASPHSSSDRSSPLSFTPASAVYDGAVRLPAVAVLIVFASVFAAGPARAADVRLKRIGRFDEPVYVTGLPGAPGRLVVVERYGRIRVVVPGRRSRILADLRSRVRIDNPRETVDQRGLFSVAFPRDYRRSGRFYAEYVNRAGRLRVDELRRGASGVRRILDLGAVSTQHHGGQLQFGPDGLLYVSTGMNDEPWLSQDPADPGGKILRVDPRRPQPVAELYALGLRNPWRFSFDRRTGAMFIGDVGEALAEEIDVIRRGTAPETNFGWPTFEGRRRRRAAGPVTATLPALVLTHADHWCAVTGGYVVRDRALPLYGRYVYGDLCSGRLFSARLRGARLVDPQPLRLTLPYVVSFGEDATGRLYGVSFSGAVYRFARD
jgi:glucose/arabinose dehydrogenase